MQRLLEVNIDSDEKTIRTLIDSLICASQNVQNKLGTAAKIFAIHSMNTSFNLFFQLLIKNIKYKKVRNLLIKQIATFNIHKNR